MSVFVGLDCGGSTTRLLAVDEKDRVLNTSQSGAANLTTSSLDRVRQSVESVARDCPNADFVCGAFAGLLGADQRRSALDLMAEFFPGAQLRAEPDYAAALWACPPKTDVCVIAGTGSLVCSKGGPEMRKSGGRGYLLGDEGSSFAIGRDALRAALDDPSQTGPELLEIIAEMLGTDPVSSVYKLQAPARVLAKLAVPLGTDLKAGRPYARAVFEHNMEALAAVVVKHVTDFEIGADPLAICVTGGLWKIAPTAPQIFQRALEQRMKDRQLDVYRIRTAPIHGAVALAKEMKSGN